MTGVQYIQNTKGLILIDFSIIMTVFILYLIIYSVFVTVYVFQLNESGVGKEIVIVLFWNWYSSVLIVLAKGWTNVLLDTEVVINCQ